MAHKGQARRGHSARTRLGAWLSHHAFSLRDALRRLLQRPVGSLLSMLVIAVSLTIPLTVLATLHAARIGLGTLSHETAIIQLYLPTDLDQQAQQHLLETLSADPAITHTRLITPEEGLELMRRNYHLDGLLDKLKHNPLPAVIEVHPRNIAELDALRERLAQHPEVTSARMDSEASIRLRALITAGEKLTVIFIMLLTPALAITIGNTIRLELERRSHEVRLLQLIGATPAFIRRPLLYFGGVLGLGGALLGIVLTWQALRLLCKAVLHLGWQAPTLDLPLLVLPALASIGIVLGVLAAWLASTMHLRGMQPR